MKKERILLALEGGDELFSDKIIGQYDLYVAIIDGLVPKEKVLLQ